MASNPFTKLWELITRPFRRLKDWWEDDNKFK